VEEFHFLFDILVLKLQWYWCQMEMYNNFCWLYSWILLFQNRSSRNFSDFSGAFQLMYSSFLKILCVSNYLFLSLMNKFILLYYVSTWCNQIRVSC